MDIDQLARHLRGLARHCAREAGLTADEAEECASIFALKMLGLLGPPPRWPDKPQPGWLLASARNCVRDYLRSELRRRARERTAAPTSEPVDPLDLVYRRSLTARLLKAIADIAPDQRAMLLGRYVDDLSPADLAAQSGKTANAIHQILHRARNTIASNPDLADLAAEFSAKPPIARKKPCIGGVSYSALREYEAAEATEDSGTRRMAVTNYTVIDGEIISEDRAGIERDYVTDPLGSTVALLDNTQSITDTFTFWPYGEQVTRTGATATPFKYIGGSGYYEDSLSRAYVQARSASLAAGRWTSADPLGLYQAQSTYAYADNNPTSEIDPTGLQIIPKIPKCPPGYVWAWVSGYGDLPPDPKHGRKRRIPGAGKINPPGGKARWPRRGDCAVATPGHQPLCAKGCHLQFAYQNGRKIKGVYFVCDTGPGVGYTEDTDTCFNAVDIYIPKDEPIGDADMRKIGFGHGTGWYCVKITPPAGPRIPPGFRWIWPL